MDINKILSLINADQLPPETQGEIKELIGALIETPENAAALERILFLIGVNKLDPETQEKVSENLIAVIDMAAKSLLESIGRGELERRRIKREYLSRVNENKDQSINEFAKQRPVKKQEFKWDSLDPMRFDKRKPKITDYRWTKDGYSPLSGKTYKVK